MQVNGMQSNYLETMGAFDTNSVPIGVDNRCTGCVSNRIEDFESPMVESSRAIKGFGGSRTTGIMIGTLAWRWMDDEGREHKFLIPKSFYVKGGNARLLSPQHWAQAQKDTKPIQGTGSETDARQVTLFWNQQKKKLTIPLGKSDNVATFLSAAGYQKCSAFLAEAGVSIEEEQEAPVALCMPTQVISNDEDDGDNEENAYKEDKVVQERESELSESGNDGGISPITTTFDLDDRGGTNAPAIVEDEEDRQPTNLAAELMRYHQKFGHIFFKNLQIMARLGWIPRKLANCPVPTCSSCLYAKATKRSWRSRSSDNKDEARKATKPGQCVSVDQLVSPTPGLVAQMIGFLTMTRYKYATIYVDQASRLLYIYLQKTATAKETLLGKRSFRTICTRTRRNDSGLSRRQRNIQGTQMGHGMSRQRTVSDFCRSKRTPSEWDCQATNSNPSRTRKNNAHSWQQEMAQSSY
jgi:hypothetical protein